MAEAIGLAASIAQLVTIAAGITKLSYGYINDIRNASRAQKSYLQEVSALTDVLVRLDQALQESDTLRILDARPQSLSDKVLSDYRDSLLLQRSRLEKHVNRLVWPFKDRELRKAINELSRFRENLTDFTVANTSLVSSATFRAIETMKTEQAKVHLLDSLQLGRGASKARPTTTQGTGKWFLHHSEFRSWQSGKGHVLWCHGPPGVGKSSIASVTIDYLIEQSKIDGSCVLYYSYDFASRKQQSELSLFQSLLRQAVMCGHEEVISLVLRYNNSIATESSTEDLMTIVFDLCRTYNVYIVLDAVDEADVPRQIARHIQNLAAAGCNVLVTSRDHPDLLQSFSNNAQVSAYSANEDLVRYVYHRFQTTDFAEIIDQHHSLIEAVVQKADGLFLLAKLTMDQLVSLPNIKQMRRCLADLPSGILNAYDSSIARIDAQPVALRTMAHRTINWIVLAERALGIAEIIHAFAIDHEGNDIDEEDLVPIATLLRACAGLVIIDQDRNVLALVHTTATEYFQARVETRVVHLDIAQTSINYMCLKQLKEGPCSNVDEMRSRLRDLPFLDYAAHYWGKHASEPDFEKELEDLLTRFFESRNLITSGFQALQFRPSISSGELATAVFESLPKHQEPLHVAAYWGLQSRTRILLQNGDNVNAPDSHEWTALHWASSGGHVAVMKILIDGGADVDARDSQRWTPLFWASFRNNQQALQLLLENGAQHLWKDIHGWTALHWAVSANGQAVATILLTHHANQIGQITKAPIWSRDDMAWDEPVDKAPLEIAAEDGNLELFSVLLERFKDRGDTNLNHRWSSSKFDPPVSNMWRVMNKADMIQGNENYITDGLRDEYVDKSYASYKTRMLHSAIRDKKLSVMELLIELGADVNALHSNTRSALHAAAFRRDPDFARILLRHHADVDVIDNRGQTPLHQAVVNGFEDTIATLLHGGADVNAKTRTPGKGYKRGYLQDKPPRDSSEGGLTPLILACGYTNTSHNAFEKELSIVSLLLNYGAKPAIQSSAGRTCLHHICRGGNIALLQKIAALGVDLDARDSIGMTALHHAAESGNLEMTRELLSVGAKVGLVDDEGLPALYVAARSRNLDVARCLIEHGEDINCCDRNGVTMLHRVAQVHDKDFIKFAIERGARVDPVDDYGATAMHYVIASREDEVPIEDIRQILSILCDGKSFKALEEKHGFNNLTLDWDRPVQHPPETPMSFALRIGNWRTFNVLQDLKPNVEISSDLSIAMTKAVRDVQPRAIRCLLEHGITLKRDSDPDGRLRPPLTDLVKLSRVDQADDLDGFLRTFGELGIDINESSYSGMTLLAYMAESSESSTIAALLLQHGASPYQYCRSFDSIIRAAVHRKHSFLRTILANLPQPCPEQHWTRFLSQNKFDAENDPLAGISKALLKSHRAGDKMSSVLVYAIETRNFNFAEILIADGAIDTEDQYGWQGLHHAILHDYTDLVTRLISSGANVGATTNHWAHDRIKPSGLYAGKFMAWRGQPLHIAVLIGNVDVVRTLLEKGADPNASTQDLHSSPLHGPTPLHIALGTGHSYIETPNLGPQRLQIARLLIQKGANVERVGIHLEPQDLPNFKDFPDVWEKVKKGLRK